MHRTSSNSVGNGNLPLSQPWSQQLLNRVQQLLGNPIFSPATLALEGLGAAPALISLNSSQSIGGNLGQTQAGLPGYDQQDASQPADDLKDYGRMLWLWLILEVACIVILPFLFLSWTWKRLSARA